MSSIPLQDHHRFVLALYRATRKSHATIGKLDQMCRELAMALGTEASTADLTTAGMLSWLALYGPRRAPQTIVGQLSNLRTICAIAAEEGWLDRQPSWKRLRPVCRAPCPDRGRHFSRAEIAALLGWLEARVTHLGDWRSRRLYAAVATAAYTGLRRNELLFLRLEDLDFVEQIIRVVPLPARQLKTPGMRAVPIAPELAAILADWTPHAGPEWAFPGVKRRTAWHGGKPGYRPADELRKACIAAGIPPGTWQWLRRAWATHAESAWLLSDPAIERILGHTTATSKRWYRKSDLDNLRALGQRITYQQ